MSYDEALADRVRVELADQPGLDERRMFGGLAFLINRHMALCAIGGGALMLRVDPARTDSLLARPYVLGSSCAAENSPDGSTSTARRSQQTINSPPGSSTPSPTRDPCLREGLVPAPHEDPPAALALILDRHDTIVVEDCALAELTFGGRSVCLSWRGLTRVGRPASSWR